MDEAQQLRRADDRDRVLYSRLDTAERASSELATKFTALESSVNIVKIEQGHLKELFEARFKGLERGQELQIEKFDHLAAQLLDISQDVNKSPATRLLADQIRSVDASCSEALEKIGRHEVIHGELKQWQSNVDTVLGILKWVGAGGIVATIIAIIRVIAKG